MEALNPQTGGSQPNAALDKDIEEASFALKAISHPLRLKILCLLDNGEMSVQSIIDCVGTSQSNVSKHLSLLRNSNILAARKDGGRVVYRIADQRILTLIDMMHKVFCSDPR